MSFLDDISKGISSGDFFSSALSTVANSVLGGLQLSESSKDRAREEDRYNEDRKLKLQLEALKARYGSTPQKADQSALQAQAANAVGGQTDRALQALSTLIGALQGPLSRG